MQFANLQMFAKSQGLISTFKARLTQRAAPFKSATVTWLPIMLIATIPQAGYAEVFTMESVGTFNQMEAAVSRHGNMNYEMASTWRRDANFNLQQTLQPGWMISATAIGNLINVQMEGAGNTVIVNAMQINNGKQQATVAMGTSDAKADNSATTTTNTTTTAAAAAQSRSSAPSNPNASSLSK